MKNKKWIFMGLLALAASSCKNEDVYLTDDINEAKYAKAWTDIFGQVDPNETWNMAKPVTATVTVNYATSDSMRIKFLTGNPRNSSEEVFLLGEINMVDQNTSQLTLDFPAKQETAYIECVFPDKMCVRKEVPITNGTCEVSFGYSSQLSRSGDGMSRASSYETGNPKLDQIITDIEGNTIPIDYDGVRNVLQASKQGKLNPQPTCYILRDPTHYPNQIGRNKDDNDKNAGDQVYNDGVQKATWAETKSYYYDCPYYIDVPVGHETINTYFPEKTSVTNSGLNADYEMLIKSPYVILYPIWSGANWVNEIGCYMYNVNEAKGIDSTTFVNSYMYQAWFYKSNDNNWNWDDNIKNDLWTVYTNPANPSYMRTLFYDETNNAVKVANMHLQNQETLYWKAERQGGGYYYPYYSNSYTSALPYQVQARPIIIKVPYDEYRSKGGIRIGLCLTNNNGKNNSLNGKIAYSSKKLNPDKAYFSAVKQVEMNGTTYTLIGLEDAKGGDNDCNDFMFLLETPVEIIEPESDTKGMIWTIAYEDMGSVGDFDFNDVVLRVQHIANTDATKIVTRVWLMAAGGTLPAHLYYRGESKEIDLGEVHEKFGVGEKVMVNTEYGTGFSKEPILLYANTEGGLPDFDLSTTTGAGRFVLKVEKDGQTYEVAQPTDGGTVPQGICISGQWTWPKETVEIYKAYPLVDNSTTEGGWKGGGFGTSGWENQKVSSNLVSCDKDVLTLINTAN